MALAYALHAIAQAKTGDDGIRMKLLHVNYALRGAESDGDQQLVEQFAKERSIDVRVFDVRNQASAQKRTGEGVQEWARRVRRDWFHQLSSQERAIIALAHHQNDVAENAILRMARGSGVGQLAGMSEFDAPYWRPFLNVPKAKIVSFIARQHIPHRHDSSNAKIDYSRNRVRLRILPELESLYPGATGRIAAMAVEASDLTSYVRTLIAEDFATDASAKNGSKSLAGERLRSLPRGVAIELLSGLAKESCDDTVQLSRTVLYKAWEHVGRAKSDSGHAWSCELQPGVYLALKDDRVTVGKSLMPPCQTRFRQHIKHIVGWDCRLKLGSGASVQIEKKDGSMRLFNPSPHSRTIAILSVRGQDRVRLRAQSGIAKEWRFCLLMKLWQAHGASHPVIWVDDIVVGLLDGDCVVTAAASGQKEVLGPVEELLRRVP